MSCPSTDTLWELSRAPLAAAEALSGHLASCPDCQGRLEDIRAVQLGIPAAPVPPRSLLEWQRLDARILSVIPQRRPSAWRRLLRAFDGAFVLRPAFALAALVGVGATLWFAVRREPVKRSVPVAARPEARMPLPVSPPPLRAELARVKDSSATVEEGEAVHTSKGARLRLELPDESEVELEEATEVRLDSLARHRIGLTLSTGAVVVSAPHDASRVLEVSAGDVSVQVLGTRFAVTRRAGAVEVVVYEGAVRVVRRGHPQFDIVPAGKVWSSPGKMSGIGPVVAPSPPRPPRAREPPANVAVAPPPDWEAVASPAPPAPPWVEVSLAPQKTGPAPLRWPPGPVDLLKELQQKANAGACEQVVRSVDASLKPHPLDGGLIPRTTELMRRSLLEAKARCLDTLGRHQEAEALRREPTSPP